VSVEGRLCCGTINIKYRVLRSEAIMRYHPQPSTFPSRHMLHPSSPASSIITRFIHHHPHSPECYPLSSPFSYTSNTTTSLSSNSTIPSPPLTKQRARSSPRAEKQCGALIFTPPNALESEHSFLNSPTAYLACYGLFSRASFPGGIATTSIKRGKNHGYESSTSKRQLVEPEMSTVEGCTTPITITECVPRPTP
jgi:hypothetical protein